MGDAGTALAPVTAVETLRARIAVWRTTRTHRGAPMPAALWTAAVALARRHGVGPMARALSLDQGSLKRRTEPMAEPASPHFIEIGRPVAGLGPSVITWEAPRGRRLCIEASALTVGDLLAVVDAWSRRR